MQVLNDNGLKSLSRQFKSFANEWFFELVARSLYHPIAWPRILSNLLCKGTKNGSGPSIGLFNLRNVPKDQTQGSPARRLMSVVPLSLFLWKISSLVLRQPVL